MIKTKEVKSGYNRFLIIVGETVEELLEFCLPRIRRQSINSYKKILSNELQANGNSSIDVHAGMGTYYDISLKVQNGK